MAGLEPARPKATDFESVVYTNFTTLAHAIELQFRLLQDRSSFEKHLILYTLVYFESINVKLVVNVDFIEL